MNTSFLPYFKSSFAHGGFMSKNDLEKLYGMLKNITGENGVEVRNDFGRGIRIVGSGVGDDPTKWAFGCTVSGAAFTVQAGVVNIFGSKKFELNGGTTATPTTYNYGGSSEYCWICVKIYLNVTTAPEIIGLSAYPDPTNSEIYWPLSRFVSDDGGTTYYKDGNAWILHRGDINILGPIVWA